ncbi:LOW QUALITY PROTEIN: hypothetical protein U9M48_007207, partial [Paspalum notatum var. saurae]
MADAFGDLGEHITDCTLIMNIRGLSDKFHSISQHLKWGNPSPVSTRCAPTADLLLKALTLAHRHATCSTSTLPACPCPQHLQPRALLEAPPPRAVSVAAKSPGVLTRLLLAPSVCPSTSHGLGPSRCGVVTSTIAATTPDDILGPWDVDEVVGAALEFYEEKKLLRNDPLPLALEKDKDSRLLTSPLKFPGKLAVDVQNNRLFISDSNHNRIVVTNLEGQFICQVGSSEEGLVDGPFDAALFNRPQGVAYNSKRNILYVADTENHALREINFVDETVKTLAGNGTKGSDYKGGQQSKLDWSIYVLNSPWDVCYDPSEDTVYIAMAGQHQIWKHNVRDSVTKVLSGDGYERNLNGSSATNTSFAQPSGISLAPDLQDLFVADSESSSIRAVNLKTGGSRLLAGGDPVFPENLFRFGDYDGTGSDVLLQHPLGVVYASDNQVYIADSYNHKIKRLDPVTRKVTTIAGTGRAGYKDGPGLSAELSEPAGLVEVGDGRLLVADTNNNTIRYVTLSEKGSELKTLDLIGVQPPSPKPKALKRLRRRLSVDTDVINVDGDSSMEGFLSLAITVPDGYHFSKEARSKFDVETEPANAIEIEPANGFLNSEGLASLKFKRLSSSSSVGRINCKVYYCKEDDVCLYQSVAFDVKFREEAERGPGQITLSYSVKPRDNSVDAQLIAARKNTKGITRTPRVLLHKEEIEKPKPLVRGKQAIPLNAHACVPYTWIQTQPERQLGINPK